MTPASDDIQMHDADAVKDDEEEEVEFRLFNTNGPTKIRVRSPTPGNTEPAFLIPSRPTSYYFTGEPSEEVKQTFIVSAVSGIDVLSRSASRWQGCALPWKVFPADGKGDVAKLATAKAGKTRTRPGKKYRLSVRKKENAKAEKKLAEQKQAEEKEAYLREKKSKMNRQKQIKKRAKEKAQKQQQAGEKTESVD